MTKLITRLMTVILAVMVSLPTIGCQKQEKVKDGEKGLDVQVEAGGTEVKVKGSKKPDEKGKRLDVDVEHKPREESGDRDK